MALEILTQRSATRSRCWARRMITMMLRRSMADQGLAGDQLEAALLHQFAVVVDLVVA